ncbi:MAG: Gfo/Idh/MocA family oxidoreductase [Planctomycetes bacterium]|nr:Gfo/Idh/MocA family oxidoreductase [Planctomycetota bacterium]
MNSLPLVTRRDALKGLGAAALGAPMVYRVHAAAPSETVRHASFGASGMAGADISSLASHKNLKLVAVAEVDESRVADVKKRFPDVRVYSDWRVLLDKEKDLDSVNVSTPDHMHAPIGMSAMLLGKHIYCQKPLTQTIFEARQMAKVAAEKKLITQMGIQIHSHPVHQTVVAVVNGGAIGKVKQVYSWSGKDWGDRANRPERMDPIPKTLDWNAWLGVAAERPFLAGYYHPGNWRKRLDFGTGTFGDMGCHILDPVFGACGFTSPVSIEADGDGPSNDSWGLSCHVKYVFPATKFAVDKCELHWYHGSSRPPAEIVALIGTRKLNDQGSIYIGEKGTLYSPYIAAPVLLPEENFKEFQMPKLAGANHYHQFVEAVRGNGQTSAPFSYAGPLTEMVLLGCLATRFPKTAIQFDTATLKVTGNEKAQDYVRKTYRKGWEVAGL